MTDNTRVPDKDSSPTPDPPAPPPKPIELSAKVSNVVAAAGVAFMITGAVAVFAVKSDAGAAALLALGLGLFLIGLARQLPTSLKYKDLSLELQAAQKFVRETYENASPEDRPAIAERVGKLAEEAPTVAAPAVKWALTEQSLLESVRQAIALAIPSVRVEDGRSAGSKFDLVVKNIETNRSVGIEIVNGRNTSGPRFGLLLERLQVERATAGLDGLMIVSQDPPRGNAWEAFKELSDASLVVLGDEDEVQGILFLVRSVETFLSRRT